MNDHTSSSWMFDLDGINPQTDSKLGSITRMDANNFPILNGMAGSLLRLKKRRYTSSPLARKFG